MPCDLFCLTAIDPEVMHTVVVTRLFFTRRNNVENVSEELRVTRARGDAEPHARHRSISTSTDAENIHMASYSQLKI